MNEYRLVRVSEGLCQETEKWIEGRFESVEALIAFALQELIKCDSRNLDRQEEDMLQQRLRDLGYL